ncbi:MAG: PAS domain-containing protein [Gammaproteobacteria bacterium]|jgi:two-component system nitrogen regulation sensor histidine kinase GlnL|nr:PAS domain-containing protein [Gammaproteobacteria bacterium]MBT5746610.1 PAS domain-containing protein [Gammaproteobacteria bacterium]
MKHQSPSIPQDQLRDLVLEHTAVAQLVIDPSQRLQYLNPAAEILFGISANKAQGHKMVAVVDISCDIDKGIERVEESDFPYTEREVELHFINGEQAIVDCSLIPLGEQRILVELQQVGQHLRIQNEERLLHQNRASADLLRGLAHEIKNPLGGLRGAAQLLESELPDPALKEYTEVIIGEADRLQSLLDQMLGPNRPPQMAETNLHELLERVRTLVLAEASSGKLTIQRDYDPSIPSFPADRDLMIQALLNIVKNAAQSLNNCGEIQLRTRVKRQVTIGNQRHRLVCSLEIEDSGPGISEELRNTIFLPMVTGRSEGTGLGLSIAQSIVQRQGGVIECESKPGQTIFTLLIPLESRA